MAEDGRIGSDVMILTMGRGAAGNASSALTRFRVGEAVADDLTAVGCMQG
jgi:hypothetical protein